MLPRVILHLDMNSYFASVEQQANPWLRGKPVGVVATMSPNGCIIASSVEAKAKGIKTGCRVQEARQRDPRVILIPNDAAKYRSCTEGILRIFHRYTEEIEHYSIDEAFLDLTGFVHSYDEAVDVAGHIRRDIQAEVGNWLRCSVGIAPTRWLAKFGGDVAPKGGTLVVCPANFETTLDPHRITDAWGIASHLEVRLNTLGIYTLGELRRYPVVNLMQAFGIMGYQLWANVNGVELGGVQRNAAPRSIGHSHVFAKRATSLEYPKAVLAKLCEKAGRRLRRLEYEAGGIWLAYGLADSQAARYGRSGGSSGRKLGTPILDTRDIFRHCWRLLTADLPPGAVPNFLAMGLVHLRPRSDQLTIWPPTKNQDAPALAAALDHLNDVYGDFTVTRGTFWGLDERDVPDRVGFRKTVLVDDATGNYQW